AWSDDPGSPRERDRPIMMPGARSAPVVAREPGARVSRISAGTRRRLRMLAWTIGGSVVAGGVYGSLASAASGNEPREGLMVGVIRGLTLSSVVGGIEVFLTRTRLGRALERAPFLVTIGLKALVYGTLIVGVEAIHLGSRLAGSAVPATFFGSRMAAMS